MECNIKDISIYYEVFGEGKPVIILHGYCLDHRVMTGCLEPVFESQKGYKRIYLDLPGMGKTKGEKWIVNADIMLDIIIEFIDKVIPKENFLLIGESYGGYLSRGILHKMFNRVEGLLLICPVIIADKKKRNLPPRITLSEDKELLSKLSEEEVNEFKYMTVVQNIQIYERCKNEIISAIKISDENFLESYAENGYEFTFDVDKLENKFSKPTLFLLGYQDSTVGYKDVWNILDNYSRATFAILDRSGHNLQIEQEELFNSLVIDWLDRINK